MRKTHVGQLPSGVETRLPLRVDSCNEMSRKIKHHGARQQKRDKTGHTECARKHGLTDQQKARAATEEQGYTVGGDSQQNDNRNRVQLPATEQIIDTLAERKSCSQKQGGKLGGRQELFRELIEQYGDDRVERDVPNRSRQRRS